MSRMHHRTFATITFTLLLMTFLISFAKSAHIEVDKAATVSTVIDGSSFIVDSGETIILAGIDTAQSGQHGFNEAKNYLASIVLGKSVYLDIDDLARTDQYGRLLCVAYVDYNLTHFENVNMAMIVNNYAVPSSLNGGEFDPTSWSWFVPRDAPVSSPSATSTAASTMTPSETPYTPPSATAVTPDVPEFSAFIALSIVSIVTIIILLQFCRKK